jgi:hypothetical protein
VLSWIGVRSSMAAANSGTEMTNRPSKLIFRPHTHCCPDTRQRRLRRQGVRTHRGSAARPAAVGRLDSCQHAHAVRPGELAQRPLRARPAHLSPMASLPQFARSNRDLR